MSKVCQVTGKRPMVGNNVSHAHNKTKRRFYPNLQTKRVWVDEEQCFVKLKLSTRALRTMEKRGVKVVVDELRAKGMAL